MSMNVPIKELAIGGSGLFCAEVARRFFRWKGQKKLQKRVNETSPAPIAKDLPVPNDSIHLSLVNDSNSDLSKYQEVQMNDDLAQNLMQLSFVGGETIKALLNAQAFNGLLKCDIPLKYLCRIKDNPAVMRGFVLNNGKITKQAAFTEVGLEKVTPLFVFQCLSVITSQYYQHVISENLIAIDAKLGVVIKMLEADDKACLTTAYDQCLSMSRKNTYDIADKGIMSACTASIQKIRDKYNELLSGITNLDIESHWSDKKEAEHKIKKLQSSNYFNYLDMVILAEALLYMSYATSIKVAQYLNNEEDANIYLSKINLNFWYKYVDQFNRLKHDVIKYIEIEEEKSLFGTDNITALKNAQIKRFADMEAKVQSITSVLDSQTTLYIQTSDDGTAKAFISLSKQ